MLGMQVTIPGSLRKCHSSGADCYAGGGHPNV